MLIAVVVMATVAATQPSACAHEAVNGEFWTYAFEMRCQGFEVEGEYTVAFEEKDAVELGGQVWDVNVFSVVGMLLGEDEFLTVPVTIKGGLRGTILQPVSGFGLLKDDTTMWCNITYDFGSDESTVRTEEQTVYTASPPWFNGFRPGKTALSDSWFENVTETVTYIEREAGIELVREVSTETVSYSFVVSDLKREVTTPAGDFSTIMITIGSGDGHTDIYWWADVVDNFVMEEHYGPSDDLPYSTSLLTGFENKDPASAAAFVAAGVAAAVVATAVLFFVLLKTREPAPPSQPLRDGSPPGRPPIPPSS
jgi:hypothetical protein